MAANLTHRAPRAIPMNPAGRVAVVGGGYAGLAAAATLATAGLRPVVFESARTLGGRARRVDGDPLTPDNGQHLLVGAYSATLDLMERVGVRVPDAFVREPLRLEVHETLTLRARSSSRLSVALAFLRAEGLGWSDRLAALRLLAWLQRTRFRVTPDRSVEQWLDERRQPPMITSGLWHPLCYAALNTPPALASAQVFATVIGETLQGPRGASDLLYPRIDLSALLPDPAAEYIRGKGGAVITGQPVRSIRMSSAGFELQGPDCVADALVLATPPWVSARLLAADPRTMTTASVLHALDYQPIYTTYLAYSPGTRLAAPMVGLRDDLVQWVVDRGQLGGPPGLLAAVTSAQGTHQAMSLDAVGARVAATLRECGLVDGDPLRLRTIAERRATFTCRPGVERPATETAIPGLFLAGDYVESPFPGTLESAVRSGLAAAEGVITRVGGGKRYRPE